MGVEYYNTAFTWKGNDGQQVATIEFKSAKILIDVVLSALDFTKLTAQLEQIGGLIYDLPGRKTEGEALVRITTKHSLHSLREIVEDCLLVEAWLFETIGLWYINGEVSLSLMYNHYGGVYDLVVYLLDVPRTEDKVDGLYEAGYKRLPDLKRQRDSTRIYHLITEKKFEVASVELPELISKWVPQAEFCTIS